MLTWILGDLCLAKCQSLQTVQKDEDRGGSKVEGNDVGDKRERGEHKAEPNREGFIFELLGPSVRLADRFLKAY